MIGWNECHLTDIDYKDRNRQTTVLLTQTSSKRHSLWKARESKKKKGNQAAESEDKKIRNGPEW